MADMAGWLTVLRLLVFTPVALLALWIHPRTTTTRQSDLIIVGCTVVAILLPSAASVFSTSPYVLIYLFGGMITMSYCTLVQRVRFRLAVVVLVAAVAIQIWCLSRRPEIDAASFEFAVSFYLSGASLLLMGSFILERTERHGFLEYLRAEILIEHIERTAHTDMLTGLANRRHFETAFEQRWVEARRSGGPLSLLIVDADHFKRYNDRHGHAVGDLVLQALAGALSSSAHRPSDVVARIGGEEFAILLPETDVEGAACVARRVHEVVAGLSVEVDGGGVGPITVSIGLACGLVRRTPSSKDLFRLADAALYEAKVSGRNRTCRARIDLPSKWSGEPLEPAAAAV
ncbi:GGDEF domain-containing protein [Methylobacterium sp. DB0501]|nr:GGDEF domain-containing protein [Methylobacterium sp. DB0501]